MPTEPQQTDSPTGASPFSRLIFVAPLVILCGFVVLKAVFNDLYWTINREDGLVEYTQTLTYLASGMIAGIISARFLQKKLISYGLLYATLAVGLFFVSMEEIGWGHRLLDYTVPEYFHSQNIQKEVSLHNLDATRSYVNEAYILIGFSGAFSWWLFPTLFRRRRHSMTAYLLPDRRLTFYFLPTFLLYLYMVCISGMLVQWTGNNAFHIGFEQSKYIIDFIDQEPVELLLAFGFLSFLLINLSRQSNQVEFDPHEGNRLLKHLLLSVMVLGISWHLLYLHLSDRYYPYDHLERGNQLHNQGFIAESLIHYREALRIDPLLAAAHNNLGRALLNLRKFEDAVYHFSEAVKLNPEGAVETYHMGLAKGAQGNLAEAQTWFSKALELNPNLCEAHLELGNLFLRAGQTEKAAKHLASVTGLCPDKADAHNNYGYTLAMTGQFDEAVHHYNEALRLRPGYPGVLINLGNLFAARGKWDEAIAQYTEVLRYQPDSALAYNNLGNILAVQGRLHEALTHYSEAIRLKNGYADAWYHRGLILKKMGKIDAAASHFRQVLKIDVHYQKARQQLVEMNKQTDNAGRGPT